MYLAYDERVSRVGSVSWGWRERERLRAARLYADHTQAECARILVTQYGVSSARQENVNRWESGAIKRPGCAEQLLAYCGAYGETLTASEATDPVDDQARSADPLSTAGFDDLAGRVVGEPLLGPAQLELVKGMTYRLRHGPPLSSDDRLVFRDQLRILGVL